MATKVLLSLLVSAAVLAVAAGQFFGSSGRSNFGQPAGGNGFGQPTGSNAGLTQQTLRFRVSARNLPDKDKLFTIDPYIKIYAVDGDSTNEYKVGRTDTLSNTQNPDFPNTFTFKFNPGKNQRLHVRVYDHDRFRTDDKAGETWVSMNDYVARGQRIEANLNKKGYVILQRA